MSTNPKTDAPPPPSWLHYATPNDDWNPNLKILWKVCVWFSLPLLLIVSVIALIIAILVMSAGEAANLPFPVVFGGLSLPTSSSSSKNKGPTPKIVKYMFLMYTLVNVACLAGVIGISMYEGKRILALRHPDPVKTLVGRASR